jgi:GTP diphosphokinase / guanosine-3',5'-bis(diphosphate) 3'-diphosphatase
LTLAIIRQYELVERVRKYNPHTDEDLLNAAYVYAMKAHGTQKRASGDPYFMHPIAVAAILTELRLDDATIVAALLHDTIEDTPATKEEIQRLFGSQIAELVDGLTKLKKLDLVTKKAEQGENLRKLLLAIAKDLRVLLIKLADRLHNMRTLHYVPESKRARIAQETLDIYTGLAGRMGMQDMREELEALAFAALYPEAQVTITHKLQTLKGENEEIIRVIEDILTAKLAENGLKAHVKGREKKPYSIFRKMQRKAISFEQLSDIIGFRVIVETVPACYAALGIVHTTWQVVPSRFKDYISTPKQNDYRSIHTTFVGPAKERVEIQIRTTQMDEIAEYGIAAHALYKDAVSGESRAFAWLRRTVETLAQGEASEEFFENTKLELFHDQVFCFTPKGLLIALPSRATALDFAYAVHTDIGDKCVGCKVNGKPTPLQSELNNGDEVEIITNASHTPYPAMESFVVTGRARAAIRRATKLAARKQFGGIGREMLGKAVALSGRTYNEAMLNSSLKRLARGGLDDVYLALGRKELAVDLVLKALFPDIILEKLAKPSDISNEKALMLGNYTTLPLHLDKNTGAVPGDKLIGVIENERVIVYPSYAQKLEAYETQPEKMMDLRWNITPDNLKRYATRLEVKSRNKPGSLAQITQIIADHDGNIDNLIMTRTINDFTNVELQVEVWDLDHLNAILSGLKAKDVVANVERLKS